MIAIGSGEFIKRFDVFLINIDPTIGREIKKTRPCLVVSPNEMNENISTVIVAPMTSQGRSYPTRVAVSFQGKRGQIVLDQIRTVDKKRLVRKLGRVSSVSGMQVLSVLQELFSP